MLKRLYMFLANANLTDSQIASVRGKMAQRNFRSLRAYSIMATLFFVSAIVVACATEMDVMNTKVYAYVMGAILSGAVLCLTMWVGDRNSKIIDWLQIVFVSILLAFGLFISLVSSPQQLTISLVAMYMITPQLFTNKPVRMQIPILIADVIFLIGCIQVKPPEILALEIVDCIVYSSIGLMTGHYSSRSKLKGLIFEKRFVELNGNEQLAKYLKSIGNIYVSMHYIDLSNETFVKIKSNSIIDNSMNNLHEGFSQQIKLAMEATTHPNYLDEMLAFVDSATLIRRIRGKSTITHEFLGKHVGWCRARFIAVGDVTEDSEPRYVLFAVENINEQKNRENTLISKAETDAMTGLLNRQAGVDRIKSDIRSRKNGMLCLFDVDKFKHVNDTYGHQAGDEVILAVADTMRKAFRDNDVLLRLGGDEFVVFVSGVTTEELGTQVIFRFFELLNKVTFKKIPDYSISLSLGAAFYRGEQDLDFETLYQRADTRTYESKKIEGKAFTFWR
ncbi:MULTISPECIES: GGDEF domain-containing protein [unclassified Fibrobacter]|uniref:GGDEF domain-containing protein n=1 Tax=unclassified Fibrobacter TaxID=2634177 RepID=UPI000D6C495D|nr:MULTISPECIES: GGDEF domain-containing protein [unclassified Fibrobacter]PWJ68371.1 diguanylate cyclase (GGDEF)-like protein [Fibrobacter sp. UWR4]PZW68095.1 diguanylate cyclase (GGDEF)-like protein [Fibrobacter sp. UWR1]